MPWAGSELHVAVTAVSTVLGGARPRKHSQWQAPQGPMGCPTECLALTLPLSAFPPDKVCNIIPILQMR